MNEISNFVLVVTVLVVQVRGADRHVHLLPPARAPAAARPGGLQHLDGAHVRGQGPGHIVALRRGPQASTLPNHTTKTIPALFLLKEASVLVLSV